MFFAFPFHPSVLPSHDFRSFDRAKHRVASTVYEEAEYPIVLVGNKTDLEEHRKVGRKETLEFAMENNLAYIELSAYVKDGDKRSNEGRRMANLVLERRIRVSKSFCEGLCIGIKWPPATTKP